MVIQPTRSEESFAGGGLVWHDGRLRRREEAMVSFDDHGFVVGDGVFETIATVDRVPFALRRHLDRLRQSAAGLHLPITLDDATVRAAVTEVIASHDGEGELRIRITVTAGRSALGSSRGDGPLTVVIAALPLRSAAATARVVVVPWTRNEHGALAGLKTTSYAENVVALQVAQRHGADEAIFANTAGELCEGTGSNVFVVLHDEVVTPPLTSGCLAGVTRALVLEAGLAVERRIPLAVFRDAEEVFLTSTTRLGQPVAAIDDRLLAPSGARTAEIASYLSTLVQTTSEP